MPSLSSPRMTGMLLIFATLLLLLLAAPVESAASQRRRRRKRRLRRGEQPSQPTSVSETSISSASSSSSSSASSSSPKSASTAASSSQIPSVPTTSTTITETKKKVVPRANTQDATTNKVQKTVSSSKAQPLPSASSSSSDASFANIAVDANSDDNDNDNIPSIPGLRIVPTTFATMDDAYAALQAVLDDNRDAYRFVTELNHERLARGIDIENSDTDGVSSSQSLYLPPNRVVFLRLPTWDREYYRAELQPAAPLAALEFPHKLLLFQYQNRLYLAHHVAAHAYGMYAGITTEHNAGLDALDQTWQRLTNAIVAQAADSTMRHRTQQRRLSSPPHVVRRRRRRRRRQAQEETPSNMIAKDLLVCATSQDDFRTTWDRLHQAILADAPAYILIFDNNNQDDDNETTTTPQQQHPKSRLLLFGNPATDTPILQRTPWAGLDLPLQFLVMESTLGTRVATHTPESLAHQHTDNTVGGSDDNNALLLWEAAWRRIERYVQHLVAVATDGGMTCQESR